ncbi:MAG TPA: hypothetical protein VK427_24240, partial [Kofleriaceae bacterium]|nr:hypothetical protein [Kofleriaceae bacterium]
GDQVAFERGFWSAFDGGTAQHVPIDTLRAPVWSTVRRMKIGPAIESQLPLLFAATRRSLRALSVASRDAMLRATQADLAIEELVLAFDTSRDPPTLAPLAGLPTLHTLGFHCLAEFAVRWLERADELGIRRVVLAIRPQMDYVKKILRRAKKTQIASLVIEVPAATAIRAVRDVDGTLAIHAIDLAPTHVNPREQLESAKQWLNELAAHVDPGVKVTMPTITPALATAADALGLRLVAHATSFAARPTFRA